MLPTRPLPGIRRGLMLIVVVWQAMEFVNKVAQIVHDNTSAWQGRPNKNMGNSFLIIWRIGDEEQASAQPPTKHQAHRYT
jgi:hypothetical protein